MSAISRRRTAALGVLLLLASVLPLVTAGPAMAALGGTTNFEIDGNTSGGDDWDSGPGGPYDIVVTADGCNDQSDDQIVPSTKLDDPWVTNTGKVLGKGDLCTVWTGHETLGDGDVIFYFAWERRTTQGEVTVYVPLDSAPVGTRNAGDTLIKFEYDDNSKTITVTTLEWTGTVWGNEASLGANVDAAISGATDFGEAAVNLTDSGILSTETCQSLVGARMITETGQADANPTLKDNVGLAEPVEFNTCGTIVIQKVSTGGIGTFDFTGDLGAFSIETTAQDTPEGSTFTNVDPGVYAVSEVEANLPLYWELTSATCDDGSDPSAIDLEENETVTCTFTNTYTPPDPLSVSKTAEGTYDRTVTWELDKTVTPTTQTGKVGQEAGTSTWTVDVTKTEETGNFAVTGTITVTNSNDFPVAFEVSDTLSDGTPATITCPGTEDNTGTVPANDSVDCDYSASPSDASAESNTVVVTSSTEGVLGDDATEPVSFVENLIGVDDGTLDDARFQYSETVGSTDSVDFDETFSCPASTEAEYVNGEYSYQEENIATLTVGQDVLQATATVTVTCSLQDPLQVSKTASGSYDRTVTWELDKSVAPATHSGTAGGTAGSSTWTVVATKNVVEDNFLVTGDITITNPNDIAVAFSVSDTLNDGTSATVECPSSTVPAGDSVVCSYSATPADASATLNTVVVTSQTDGVLGDEASAAVSFAENLVGDESGTLADARFEYSNVIEDSTTVTFDETFRCPLDAQYVNGVYQYTVENIATLAVGDGLQDSATVTVTCTREVVTTTTTTQPQTASVGDLIWYDANGDGIQQPNEPGIPGVTVELIDSQGNVVATTVTDANGNYLFENVTPGTYQVRWELPDYDPNAPEAFTLINVGDEVFDSDALANGITQPFEVIAGANIVVIDAGVIVLEVAGTTISADTLPFTGFESQDVALAALLALAGGSLLLLAARKEEDEAVTQTSDTIGRWNRH